MRGIYLLLIILIVVIWYGIIPIAGAYYTSRKWRRFRRRFNGMRLCTALDYRQYRQLGDDGGIFRFTGGIESITDGHTLWVRSKDMTIPVSLDKTKCFLLPIQDGEAPEQIFWNKVCTLTEGSKVFIGGLIKKQNNRLSFCSTKEEPLMVIFYNCPEDDFPARIVGSARARNEYWNSITPISVIIGALSLLYFAASLLERPAFRLTVIISLTAIFIPILPAFPPGFLFTALYRRMSFNARKLKTNWELVRFGLSPKTAGYNYAAKAYIADAIAWLALITGIIINIIFIFILLFQFNIISV